MDYLAVGDDGGNIHAMRVIDVTDNEKSPGNLAGGLLRTSTRPTLNLHLLLHASVNKHLTDVESPPPPLRVCTSVHPDGRSCSDISLCACSELPSCLVRFEEMWKQQTHTDWVTRVRHLDDMDAVGSCSLDRNICITDIERRAAVRTLTGGARFSLLTTV